MCFGGETNTTLPDRLRWAAYLLTAVLLVAAETFGVEQATPPLTILSSVEVGRGASAVCALSRQKDQAPTVLIRTRFGRFVSPRVYLKRRTGSGLARISHPRVRQGLRRARAACAEYQPLSSPAIDSPVLTPRPSRGGLGDSDSCPVTQDGQSVPLQPFTPVNSRAVFSFSLVPTTDVVDAHVAISMLPLDDPQLGPVVIRLSPSGYVEAKDGPVFSADRDVSMRAGTRLGFRVVVDIPLRRYSVWVTKEGLPEELLARDYDFGASINSSGGWTPALSSFLAFYGGQAMKGSLRVCRATVMVLPPPSSTPTASPTATPTTPSAVIPSEVTGASASWIPGSQVEIRWTHNGQGLSYFYVTRSPSFSTSAAPQGGLSLSPAAVLASGSAFVWRDQTAPTGQLVRYDLQACNANDSCSARVAVSASPSPTNSGATATPTVAVTPTLSPTVTPTLTPTVTPTFSSTIPPSGGIQVAFESSRPSGSSCVAPCAIHVDAHLTTKSGESDPWSALSYSWDFGNPNALPYANASSTAIERVLHPNHVEGPLAAHVYESPGVYEVRLTARDVLGNQARTASGYYRITVQDPAVVFAAGRTQCYASSQAPGGCSFVGCPTGAKRYCDSVDLTPSIAVPSGGALRVLFQRGGVFPGRDNITDTYSPLQFGAYGGLTEPPRVGPMYVYRANNLTFFGLAFIGNYDPVTVRGVGPLGIVMNVASPTSSVRHVLIHRNQFQGLANAISTIYQEPYVPSGGNYVLNPNFSAAVAALDRTQYLVISDNRISNWQDYGIYGPLRRAALIGNSIQQARETASLPKPNKSPGSGSADHGPIRTQEGYATYIGRNTFFSNNTWFGTATSPQPCLRFVGGIDADKAVIRENYFENGSTIVQIGQPGSGYESLQARRTLVESNLFVAGRNTEQFFTIATGDIRLRNNLFVKYPIGPRFTTERLDGDYPYTSRIFALAAGNDLPISNNARQLPNTIAHNTIVQFPEAPVHSLFYALQNDNIPLRNTFMNNVVVTPLSSMPAFMQWAGAYLSFPGMIDRSNNNLMLPGRPFPTGTGNLGGVFETVSVQAEPRMSNMPMGESVTAGSGRTPYLCRSSESFELPLTNLQVTSRETIGPRQERFTLVSPSNSYRFDTLGIVRGARIRVTPSGDCIDFTCGYAITEVSAGQITVVGGVAPTVTTGLTVTALTMPSTTNRIFVNDATGFSVGSLVSVGSSDQHFEVRSVGTEAATGRRYIDFAPRPGFSNLSQPARDWICRWPEGSLSVRFDFSLSPASPAIDRGAVMRIAEDYRGAARPRGASVDMGAFEVQ